MRDRVKFDGVWKEEFKFQPHEGILYRRLSQPSRALILERNARLRAKPGSLRDLTFARLGLTIPLEDYHDLRLKYPDLASRDAQIRTAAWLRFIRSGESEPYRVGTKV